MAKHDESILIKFGELNYRSASHALNKAVIAAYNNVVRYGYSFDGNAIVVRQMRHVSVFALNESGMKMRDSSKKCIVYSESVRSRKVSKEICYDLAQVFSADSGQIARGIKFSRRGGVRIDDFVYDERLDVIYEGWKRTKECDRKTYLMTFNPARYRRSYVLKRLGYSIYQKIVLIRGEPYALINFALDGHRSYELSFLSLFADRNLKLINDQNDCIILSCLYDLHKNYGIKTVNLGTSAGIKGLAFFKRQFPHFEILVYAHTKD